MIKVLFFIPTLSGGGAEKVLCNLVNNMDPEKFHITVQTVEPCDYEKYLNNNIRYKSIIHSNNTTIKNLLMLWFRICTQIGLTYSIYIKDNYDIEVAYLECGATKVLSSSSNKHAKKIAWVHCNAEKKGLTKEKSGKHYGKFDHVICVSKDAQNSFNRVFTPIESTEVLYNVIDEKEIYEKVQNGNNPDWNPDVIHLCTIGRLCSEKGSDRMLEVCRLLHEEGVSFFMHYIGDGPQLEELKMKAKEYQLEDVIFFEGYSPNPYPYIQAADIIVIPSRSEALSTVAIESLILGRCIVTTPCSGMHELFGDSQYGVITEDSIDSLFVNLKKVMLSDELRKEYEKAAKSRSILFSKSHTLQVTEEFFMSLIEG